MTHSGIKIGDVVQLRSGGPLMTVDQIVDGDTAVCVWFDEDGDPFDTSFNLRALEIKRVL